MENTYPILIDGQTAGELTRSVQGLMTVFEGRCALQEGIFRLWVYGEDGQAACLGVMEPRDGALYLKKRMTRMECQKLPQPIAYAGGPPAEAGTGAASAQQPAPAQVDAAAPAVPAPQPDTPPNVEGPADAADTGDAAGGPDADTESAQKAAEEEPDAADTLWFSTPDGILVRFDGKDHFLALPLGNAQMPPGRAGRLRIIEGKKYMVFQTKNGRIV